MENNKPDNVADPNQSGEISPTEVVRERRLEAGENIKDVSTLVPKSSQGSTADVAVQGSSSDDGSTKTIDLKQLEASAGRKFESAEDFVKHYANLYGRYGDQEVAKALRAADTLQSLEKKFGKSIDEIEKLVSSPAQVPNQVPVEQPKPQAKPVDVVEAKPNKSVSDDVVERLTKLEHETQLGLLEKKYPDAAFVAAEIAVIAKEKGISYVKAFEESSLKQLVELKSKEESKRSPVVTPSNRTNVDYKNLEQLGLKVMTGKAKEADQVAFAKEFFKTRGREL